jgi:hypothetical protein
LGDQTYGAFVRDEIGFADFVAFMRATARRQPGIYDQVFRQLTLTEVMRWSWALGRLGLQKWRSGT